MNHLFGLIYCILYGASSFCFSLIIKYLSSTFQSNLIFMLLLSENILTVFICLFLNKRTHFSKETFLFSLLYAIQTYTGIKGLQIINISLYTSLRRTLILFVFLIQRKWSISNFIPVLLITLGSILAGIDHFDQNIQGYIYILFNNVFNALALNKSKQLNTEKCIDPLELTYQNAYNQIPFLLLGALTTSEMNNFYLLINEHEYFLLTFTLSSLFGVIFCYLTNLCTMRNSPTAIAITNNVKDMIMTSYSFFYLKEDYNTQILIGILVSYIGSIIYSIQKILNLNQQSQQNQKILNNEDRKIKQN